MTRADLLVGDHTVIRQAMKQLSYKPPTNCYPDSLTKFLGRRVTPSTLGLFLQATIRLPVFVKPQDDTKVFTGRVVESLEDVYDLQHVRKRTKIHVCHTILNWKSEWRVFVLHGQIVGKRCYFGDPHLELDMMVVQNAVDTLQHSNDAEATGTSVMVLTIVSIG